jgi:hypothetical protein
MMAKKKKAASSKAAKRSAKGSNAGSPRQSRKAAEKVLRDGPIRKRPRQERLPGVEEDPGSKAIDNAAYDYVEARDARMAATTVETQRATKLIAIIKRERPGQKAYKHTVGGETIIVNITAKDPTEKVKVKIAPVDEPALGEGATVADEPADVEAMDAEPGDGDVSVE